MTFLTILELRNKPLSYYYRKKIPIEIEEIIYNFIDEEKTIYTLLGIYRNYNFDVYKGFNVCPLSINRKQDINSIIKNIDPDSIYFILKFLSGNDLFEFCQLVKKRNERYSNLFTKKFKKILEKTVMITGDHKFLIKYFVKKGIIKVKTEEKLNIHECINDESFISLEPFNEETNLVMFIINGNKICEDKDEVLEGIKTEKYKTFVHESDDRVYKLFLPHIFYVDSTINKLKSDKKVFVLNLIENFRLYTEEQPKPKEQNVFELI